MGVWGENCWTGRRLPAAVGEKVKKGRMSSAVVASVAPAPHGLIPRVACIIMTMSEYLCACVVCVRVCDLGEVSADWLAAVL